MRRKRGFRPGRIVVILGAVFFGYLLGNWNASVRSTEATAAQTVAQRFPEGWHVPAAQADVQADMSEQLTPVALFDPAPMAPQPVVPQARMQLASADATAPLPAAPAPAAAPHLPPAPASTRPAAETRPARPVAPETAAVAAARHRASRPGFVLDDAQIASIKQRLHLTPDQEQMWPAVEVALRNLAYTRAREAARRGAHANMQLAAADPNSTEVQDLKSAAIPLIMSFNSEQRDEVRSLAHVMGLDQLANQF